MKHSIITPPAGYLITVDEAKEHLRIPEAETLDDSYIEVLITAGSDIIEKITNRKLITQTVEFYLDEFPADREIELPFGYVQSVTSLKYYDTNGTEQTFNSSNYELDNKGVTSRIKLVESASFPSIKAEKVNAVTVRFICGYGVASAVPKPIRQALLFLISNWYENREPVSTGAMVQVPMTFELILASYRIYFFG